MHGVVFGNDSVACVQATVSILRLDSSIIQETFTRKDGRFKFESNPPYGAYILSIRHLTFSPVYRKLTFTSKTNPDLGYFILTPRVDSLQAVVIAAEDERPHFRGDTLEYNTSGVKLNRYANIEALLSRLPGVQVNPDGTITINGQRVQRLLVDGEDLFGSDPTIVTRNFNANMIDKVQLLNKRDRKSEFTGIDDGTRTKTLNLVLKESSKHGYYGKVEGGVGDQGYYDVKGLLGSFVGHQQIVGLAMSSDIGNIAFNFGDADGSLLLSPIGNDPLGANAGGGVPTVSAVGGHYANSWNGKQDHTVGNYEYGHSYTLPFTETTTSQALSDSVYVQQSQNHSINSQDLQGLNLAYTYSPTERSSIDLSFSGANRSGHNELVAFQNSSFNDTLANSSERNVNSDVTDHIFNGAISWRMQGEKRGRVFSIVTAFSHSNSTADGYVYSLNQFYQPNGSLLQNDTTDQRKGFLNTSGLFSVSSSYVDSIGKHMQIGFSYTFSSSNSQANQDTYNKDGGKYDEFVDSLSSHYKDVVTNNVGGVIIINQVGKLKMTSTANFSSVVYRQEDQLLGTNLRYGYFSFLPRIQGDYAMGRFSAVSFTYTGSSVQPAIQLLQPVQNNTDPLHISLGNPNLRPMYTHSINGSYQSFRALQLTLAGAFTINNTDISTRTITDSLGRQISEPINVEGAKTGAADFSIGYKIKPYNLDVRFNAHQSYGRSYNYVNATLSANDILNSGAGISINKFVPDKYAFSLSGGGSYSYSRSSVDESAAIGYWVSNGAASASFFPMKGLEMNSQIGYTWREKTSAFDTNSSIWAWNAAINKDFWDGRVTVHWSFDNIFNQNAGITRSSLMNTTTETITNTIGRHWLISAAYHFDHKFKKK